MTESAYPLAMDSAYPPLPASAAELSRSAKHAAFAAVLGPDGRSGDDTFTLTSPFAPSENLIPPVLLKSIARIESDWTQYSGTQTLVNWGSCDYGMLQINGDTSSAWTLREVVLTRIEGTTNVAPSPTATPFPAPASTSTPIACPPQQQCLEPTLAPARTVPSPHGGLGG